MNEKTETAEGPGSDTPEPEVPETHEHPPEKQGSGGSAPFLATLIVVVVLGGAFFYLWQQQSAVKADMRALEGSIDKLLEVVETRHQELLTTTAPHQHSAMDEGIRQNSEQLGRLQNQLNELQLRVGQDHFGWMVAEVDYLLRIAEHRLSLEHDRETAIAALRTARNRLEMQDRSVFADVIQQIDDDINAIDAIEAPNRNLLANRIAELLERAERLPLSSRASTTPQTDDAPSTTAADDNQKTFWQKILHDLRGLVTIRRESEVKRPVLAPQPRYFLRQNLQLKLESARLALLNGNTRAWRTTLNEAADWLSRYYDVDNEQVNGTITALEQLSAVELNPPLPTLDATRTLLQQTAQQAADTGEDDSAPRPADEEEDNTQAPDSTEENVEETTETTIPEGGENTAPAAEKPPGDGETPAPQPPADDMPPMPEGEQP
ncbi:MAG: uroporphyrinogen-III C-methyltransferase [Pseudomonadota bacterium]